MRATIEPISWLGLPRMSCEASGSSSMRSSSIARRSAGVTGVANGSSPASSASSCSTWAQKPWTVVTVSSSKPPSRLALEALAQRVGAGLRDGQREDRLRRQALLAHQPGEALAQDGRLARAGAAQDEQRAARVRDGLELARGSATPP